jgi:hypothetical protein
MPERQGLLEHDAEHAYLAGDGLQNEPIDALRGASITYHVALGPHQGRKVYFIARLAALVPKPRVNLNRFARIVLLLARFAGQLKRPKFIPDELVTGSLRQTVTTGRGRHRPSGARVVSLIPAGIQGSRQPPNGAPR